MYVFMCMYVCMYVCNVCVGVFVCMYVCNVFVCMYVFMCMSLCVCNVCICAYVQGFLYSMMFGAILSATDPVSVVDLLKRTKVSIHTYIHTYMT